MLINFLFNFVNVIGVSQLGRFFFPNIPAKYTQEIQVIKIDNYFISIDRNSAVGPVQCSLEGFFLIIIIQLLYGINALSNQI